ncbi:hypothetical protein DESPIG_01537 [Desulfovibrio piger ATCC 29098]|uniref:Uncharacterized protein n=1 Tax=Desulfovibrio piger ATCC 29098 TaxID=411464 RepID=B6WTX9_9BACT|nr:hypothetical protein DESPIG_01537 [Desulfovibrio piger ATCC 29098]
MHVARGTGGQPPPYGPGRGRRRGMVTIVLQTAGQCAGDGHAASENARYGPSVSCKL